MPRSLALLLLAVLATSAAAASWKSEGPFFGNVVSIAIDPARPERLWAATHGGGVWRSVDGGKSWAISGTELSGYVITYVAFQPKNTIWAGVEQSALARSDDGGATWEWVDDDLAYSPFPLAFDPANPKSIWIPDVNLHERSSDGGETWTEFRVSGGNVWTFEVHPADPKIIWAGGENRSVGLWKSTDGGTSWRQQLAKGLPESNGVRDLIIHPTAPDTLYMRTRRGGFRSADGGATWTPFGGRFPQSEETESLVMHPSSPQTLYAGTEKGLFMTTDGGSTWKPIENGLPRYVISALAIHPTSPETMWAGSAGAGIYKTIDGGKTWAAANDGFAASWIENVRADEKGTIFAETSIGEFRTDGGGGWVEITEPGSIFAKPSIDSKIPKALGVAADEVKALVIDPADRARLYVATAKALSRSEDGGASFAEAYAGEDEIEITGAAVDAEGNVYVSTREGIVRSSDQGRTWLPFNEGLTNTDVRALYSTGKRLYAGTAGGGVFSLSQ